MALSEGYKKWNKKYCTGNLQMAKCCKNIRQFNDFLEKYCRYKNKIIYICKYIIFLYIKCVPKVLYEI